MRRSALLITLIATAASACSNPATEPSAPSETSAAKTVEVTRADPSNDDDAATSTLPVAATLPSVTAAQQTEEQLVVAAHTRFMAMFGTFGDPPNPAHPEILATTTGALRSRLQASLTSMQAQGRRSTGGYLSDVRSVRVQGDHAWIEDCSLDQGIEYGPDGAVVTPADSDRFLRTAQLVRGPEGWQVEDFYLGAACGE